MNYLYKFIMAIVLTPVIYVAENRMDKYLGKDKARQMKREAMGQEGEFENIPAAG